MKNPSGREWKWSIMKKFMAYMAFHQFFSAIPLNNSLEKMSFLAMKYRNENTLHIDLDGQKDGRVPHSLFKEIRLMCLT